MNVAIIVSLFAIFLAFMYDRKRIRWGLIGAMCVLTIFTAIRWEWGNDMPTYAKEFEAFGNEKVHFWEYWEFGDMGVRTDRTSEVFWFMINIICQPIGFFGMTIVLSVLQGWVVYRFIKDFVPRGYTYFAIFIYCFNPRILVLGCSMMRQWIAMCAILVSMKYLCEKRLLPFVVFVIFASLFHTSSLFLLVVYAVVYLDRKKVNLSYICVSFFLILIWVFIIGKRLTDIISTIFVIGILEQYTSLITNEEDAASIGIATMMNVIVALVGIYTAKQSGNDKIQIISMAYLCFVFFLPFSATIMLGGRMLCYFDAISIAVLPNILKNSKISIVKSGVFLWVIMINLYNYIQFFHSKTWHHYFMNYHTIFEAPYWM